MQILNSKQMRQKIDRMAFEIAERNITENEIYFLGINNNGYALAHFLLESLRGIDLVNFEMRLGRVRVNASNPLKFDAFIEDVNTSELSGRNVILVDDVANTGRTLYYAFEPLMQALPKKLEVAVMVDRKHKMFPVHVDYVGLSLATTLMENILVDMSSLNDMNTILE